MLSHTLEEWDISGLLSNQLSKQKQKGGWDSEEILYFTDFLKYQ